MAQRWNISYPLSSLALLIIFALFSSSNFHMAKATNTTVPAIFIFGDSISDVGTNNYLPSGEAKADFPFNGIDLPGKKPTGRFSNGFNIADTIARLYGFKRSPPAFLHLMIYPQSFFKKHILSGANFASAGAGLLDTTGLQFGKVITMKEQVKQFAIMRNNIWQLMGQKEAQTMLSKSLVVINIGSNDIFEYFEFRPNYTKQGYMDTLMDRYRIFLKDLFELGARKFGIVSVSSIGCTPIFRMWFSFTKGNCLEPMNSFARLFFVELQALLQNLSMELEGMKYSLVDTYNMTMAVINNPRAFGFKDAIRACCGAGVIGERLACVPNATVCKNHDDLFFWDRYHPNQKGSELAEETLYTGSYPYVTPINFSRLVEGY